MNPLTRQWNQQLEENGYRLTTPRKAVVEVMASSINIMSAADIFFHARQVCPKLGLVTVYRTIEKLEELQLIQRVHQDDSCHSYIAVRGEHQHLLICEKCKQTVYFNGDDLYPLIVQLSEKSGYRIQHHWLQLSGLCRKCQSNDEEKEIS